MSEFNVMGGVDFPIDSQEYVHTGEHGMFVRAVVVPRSDAKLPSGEGFQECIMDGNLVGDNRPKIPKELLTNLPADSLEKLVDAGVAEENFLEEMNKLNDPKRYHFPFLSAGATRSRDYLAVVTLGSTSWCGHGGYAGEYWNCDRKNLNALGRLIVESLESMYGKYGDVILTTWINT